MQNNNDKEVLDFIFNNGLEEFFVSILEDCADSKYTQLGYKLTAFPYKFENEIKSLIISSYGSNYYCYIQPCHYDWMMNIIKPEIDNIFLLYFQENVFEHVARDLKNKFRHAVHYYVMKLTKLDFSPHFLTEESQTHILNPLKKNNFYCDKLHPKDYDVFHHIQKKYHLEEVYENKDVYPEKSEMKKFKNSLSTGINFGVSINDIACAKASVNGISKNLYQIGGVFTDTPFRNKGIATHLLSTLISYLLQNKPEVSLFVRQDNFHAIKAYKSLGFKIIDKTVLAYVDNF